MSELPRQAARQERRVLRRLVGRGQPARRLRRATSSSRGCSTPRDFGIVAVGATLMMFTTSLADGGLGSGLIRREHPPDRAGAARPPSPSSSRSPALLAVARRRRRRPVGGAGLVVALMMAALPIAALQTPGRVMLSRDAPLQGALDRRGARRSSVLRLGGRLVVLAGLGVWALASAVVVRRRGRSRRRHRRRAGSASCCRRSAARAALQARDRVRPALPGRQPRRDGARAGPERRRRRDRRRRDARPVDPDEAAARVPGADVRAAAPRLVPVHAHVLAAKQDPAQMLDRGVAVASTASGVVLVGDGGRRARARAGRLRRAVARGRRHPAVDLRRAARRRAARRSSPSASSTPSTPRPSS